MLLAEKLLAVYVIVDSTIKLAAADVYYTCHSAGMHRCGIPLSVRPNNAVSTPYATALTI